ncbi:MAG: hypothetical protein JXM70_02025 [Pirellulales bacterium]|nr:hypothetical protein [Pirellulales bacterium]
MLRAGLLRAVLLRLLLPPGFAGASACEASLLLLLLRAVLLRARLLRARLLQAGRVLQARRVLQIIAVAGSDVKTSLNEKQAARVLSLRAASVSCGQWAASLGQWAVGWLRCLGVCNNSCVTWEWHGDILLARINWAKKNRVCVWQDR